MKETNRMDSSFESLDGLDGREVLDGNQASAGQIALVGQSIEVDSMAIEVDSVVDEQALQWSEPFVGRWQTLISHTNWEKGKIIVEWRQALVDQSAPVTAYSDEAWSKQVGAVTSQHVGRLRRVFDRFGESYGSYRSLYWSHFLAALDWDDAELWLEGASRSDWSVSQMRRTRSESMGGDPADEALRDEELIASELDDGFVGLVQEDEEDARSDRDASDRIETSALAEGPDFGDEDRQSDSIEADSNDLDGSLDAYGVDGESAAASGNPFSELGGLPLDIADALEQFKLSIIRHRASKWSEVSQSQMLTVIDALRVFASR
jgi:hypothetical protein